jgi:monothiol glutaredoxin
MSPINFPHETAQNQAVCKPFCGWCHEAIDWLEQRALSQDVRCDRRPQSHERDGRALPPLAPVIEVDGKVLADFGVDELESWWKEEGFGNGQPPK